MLTPEVRNVLRLWLEFAENRRTLTARMYARRESAAQVQELLDENDRLLQEAVDRSRELLARPG